MLFWTIIYAFHIVSVLIVLYIIFYSMMWYYCGSADPTMNKSAI